MAPRKNIDWDALSLGTRPDSEIAAAAGCSVVAVGYARKRRGIQPRQHQSADCEPSTFLAETGAEPDRVIAERHGLTRVQVRYARAKAGIPNSRIDWDKVEGLGDGPDCELAERLGVDNSQVARMRRRRGIPQWHEERQCPCGEKFIAVHRRQRFCRYRCQRYHWDLVNKHGMEPEAADIAIALWAYKRTLARKGSRDVE